EERFRVGVARLRQLQNGRGGAFSFWPGGQVDVGMTALVLHGLAVMREGGVDPARLGLACDLGRPPFAAAIDGLLARQGRVGDEGELLAAELVAGCLRLQPDAERARAALAALVDAGQRLPIGLLGRCGLALLAAGDDARAE